MRSRWWAQAEAGVASPAARLARCDAFAREVDEYARFKELPLPPRCLFQVIATAPDQDSTRFDALRSRSGGLDDTLMAPLTTAEGPRSRALGGINLGDEATSLVFLNLPAAAIDDLAPTSSVEVSGGEHRPPSAGVPRLHGLPSYPLVRLLLQPGEGYWLPAVALFLMDTPAEAKPDVVLMISTG
ncbi:MAG: hypothetical protein WKF75_06325 [Singulisphaera sp.]